MKTFSFRHVLLIVGGIIGLALFAFPATAQEANKVQDLQRVIDAQQKQNEAQQRQIEAQQKQLDSQRQLLQDLQKQMETLVKDADTEGAPVAAEKPAAKPEVASTKAPPVEKVVTSGGGERTKLSINGFVNRMVSIIDDGKNTEAYFVDNDNSESRVNVVGTANINDDLTLGGRIELSIAPNKSGNVNQNEQEIDNIFEQRWTEASLLSKRFGKLSLGKGNVGAFGSTSIDLSRTGLISYSSIIDTAGGMLFRQKSDDSLTDVRIGDAFDAFDALDRKNRVR